ncbi:MAG: DEAD/DEAH box helicase family protein [Pyrinomonadaceae bacterium MAG19_C2-C3]|nr:DEAD/DEAH box helicase family protein [Pyrinomonadaceae bacterium MAG19_C2-C3]
MELKSYQQNVISDLERFLEHINGEADLRRAFRAYWDARGVTKIEDYKNNVPRVPHVCIKVPTAGGKTFIAANALRPIFESFTRINPARPKVVVWLVPSITILEQTIKNFSDVQHPYRQKLNAHFNGRVTVFTKADVLQGAGFTPDDVQAQLNIIVLSFDSLRARNKEDRKIYQENGNLAGFASREGDKETLLPEHDETALINVLRRLEPVVVVDESHNAETLLSVEMLANLNPGFILDLTATPKRNSNIISYVSALELKAHRMVKLPVIVKNEPDKTEVINDALSLRRRLEQDAEEEEKAGGDYIRPIILFQAQPRTGDDNTTFQRLKEKLVALGIPEEEIKIKTADINELKGIDLMSRLCPVRYIITVNALKEGWDCPFAYVLASLADKSSAVDVEQVLGRVLRQPYVREHKRELLNMSYVFTASNRFLDTLDNIVKGLNRAGFSERDYRAIDAASSQVSHALPTQGMMFPPLDPAPHEPPPSNAPALDSSTSIEEDEIEVARIEVAGGDGDNSAASVEARIDAITRQAVQANAAYEQQARTAGNEIAPELEDKMNKQNMKEVFAEIAKEIRIPQFFIKIESRGGFFDAGENYELLENNELLRDFRLSQCDINIQFESAEGEFYAVDVERIGDEDFKPTFKKLNEGQKARLNDYILSLPPESKVQSVTEKFHQLIGEMYPIPDREIKAYIKRIFEGMTPEQLRDCLDRDFAYSHKIKQKITELARAKKEKIFSDYLDTDKVVTRPSYQLPAFITPVATAPAITKSLFTAENGMNNFERRVINEIANLESIAFWHKIIERQGFHLNGFINHYPDFLVQTKSGKTLIVEAKGDDRDNSDSARKLKLGHLWASKAGNEYRYLMVFDNNPLESAYRLVDAVKLIAQI